MAAKKPAVEIPVRLEKDKAVKDLKTFQKEMVQKFGKVAAAVGAAKIAFDVAGAALSKFINFSKEAAQLAEVQEKAERNLIDAIRLKQRFTEKEFENLQKFNSEVQQATIIGDEQLLQLQKQLTLQGIEKSRLEEITKAVIGLAQVKGTGLAEAATVVTRVTRGEIGALKESGIVVKTVTEGVRELVSMYSLAARESSNAAGQVKLLSANYGDMLEEFGKTLTQSPEVINLVKDMNAAIMETARFISQNRELIISFWDDLATAVEGFVKKTEIYTLYKMTTELSKIAHGQIAREVAKRADVWRMDMPVPLGVADLGDPGYAPKPAAETPEQKRAREQAQRAREQAQKKREKAEKDRLKKNQDALLEFGLKTINQDEAIRQRKYALREQDLLREAAFNDAQLAQTQAFYDNLATIGLNGLGNMIANMVQAGLSGEQSLSEVMGRMFGAMLSQVGTMLVSLGTATVMAASASTPVPLLWGLTGGPAGVAAGLGLIAAGGVLTGVGQYVSSASGSTKSDLTKATGTARRMAPTSAADGGRRQQVTEETSTVYHINFNGALPGSERRIAKEMKRILGGDYSPAGAY